MEKRRILMVGQLQGANGFFDSVAEALGSQWAATQVPRGDTAQKELAADHYHIVVACQSLPDISGSDLLKSIQQSHPETVRFILSEKADKATLVQTAGHIHQAIGFPCEPETVARLVENSLSLRKFLTRPELADRIAAIGSLPSPPDIYQKLVSALESKDVSIQKVADLVSHDIGITTKLLQLVNSAYFGLPRRVDSVQHATSLLGLDTVQRIVFSTGVFRQFDQKPVRGLSVEGVYQQSMIVGAKSRLLAHAFGFNPRLIGDSLMGGMLHDVGKLILLVSFRDELVDIFDLADEKAIPLHQATREKLGVDDAAIGAYLLALWGLPDSIVEAVALHYQPRVAPQPLLNSLTAVHLGFAIGHDETRRIKTPAQSAIDTEYLKRLGLLDQLPTLQNFCAGAVVS